MLNEADKKGNDKASDKDVAYYNARKIKESYCSHLLPHMGTDTHDNHVKMRFLGE